MISWPIIFPIAGATAFLVVVIWGGLQFNAERARGLKEVENAASIEVVERHIVKVAPSHPEIVRTSRLDRHPFYLCIHGAVFGYAMCTVAGADPTSNVASLSESTRLTMAACFLVGAVLIVVSSAMGSRIAGRWWIARSVKQHLTSGVLGDDVTLPYRIGIAGMFAVSVSMLIYSSTSFKNTFGSIGGWMTGACAVACLILIPMMWRASRLWDKWDSTLIADALVQLELDTHDSE